MNNEIESGRWLTPDPLGGDITNPQSLNRYAYVLNNPTTLTDPTGLAPFMSGVQCENPWYADSHAQCQGPGSEYCLEIDDPDCGTGIPIGSVSGGGGGSTGGGTTATSPGPTAWPTGLPNGPSIGQASGFESTAQAIEQIGVYASPWEIEVLSICAGTPVCQEVLLGAAVGGAAVGGGYLVYKGIQAGIKIYQSRGRSDPISGLKPVNPGRDANGRCKPCPSGPGPWEVPGNAHGSATGTHWHWIEYNQNPQSCECFPVRQSGRTPP